MKPHFLIVPFAVRIAFTLVVLACFIPLRADILANSDFADGRAHWKGDAHPADTSDLADPSSSAGMTVTLKKNEWTKIYQVFLTKEPTLRYIVTFKLSSDYNVAHDTSGASGAISGPSPGLDDIEGMEPLHLDPRQGTWTLVVREVSWGSATIFLKPDLQKTDSQTLTGEIHGLNVKGDNEKIILLAFPPGEGSITFSNFSLTPESPDSD